MLRRSFGTRFTRRSAWFGAVRKIVPSSRLERSGTAFVPTNISKSATSGTRASSAPTASAICAVRATGLSGGASMLTTNVVSLARGSIRNCTSVSAGSASATRNARPSAASTIVPRQRCSSSARSPPANGRTQAGCAWCAASRCVRKRWYVAQGVIANATPSDASIATGTLSGIGRMYGPIIPVTNSIGRNDRIDGERGERGRSFRSRSTARIVVSARVAHRVRRRNGDGCFLPARSRRRRAARAQNRREQRDAVDRLMGQHPTPRVTKSVSGMAVATTSACRQPRPAGARPQCRSLRRAARSAR